MVASLALTGLSAVANAANGIVDTVNAALGAGAKPTAPGADKTKRTARDFETMFLEQSLERLTAETGADGPLGDNGTGGGVYKSMLVKEYAGQIVKSGGVGIAGQVYRQMLKMQEASHAG